MQVDTYNEVNQIACQEAGMLNGMCDGSDLVYMYDAYGNLTGDSTSTYVYNAANRLVSVSDGQTMTTYQYNGDGVSQTIDYLRFWGWWLKATG